MTSNEINSNYLISLLGPYMSSFYSQVFNFTSAVSGGVDPRTGLFFANFPIASLTGNAGLGPALDITLSYNPLSSHNVGCGKGITPGFSYYDTEQRMLFLSSGERYVIHETSDQPVIQQQKLAAFIFQKDEDAYRIIHKSGVIEELAGPATVDTLKMPKRMLSPLGHALVFAWDYQTSIPRLSKISDDSNLLLEVTYYGSATTTFTLWPGTAEESVLQLVFSNDYLTQVENQSLTQKLTWLLGYESVGNDYLLTQIESPTGLIQRAYYSAGLMAFPTNAGLPALPAVSRFVTTPGHGQPESTVTYEYTSTNYLGYASNVSWSADTDVLYGVLDSYIYGSTTRTEGITADAPAVEVVRHYNNFHLQTEETTTENGCIIHTETDYHAVTGALFEEQPAQFQLPASQMVTYTDNAQGLSRSELTITTFDEAGNPTTTLAPDGTRTDITYYSPEGGEGCPPDPHGFVRYICSEKITPPGTNYDAPVLETTFTYRNLGETDAVVQDSKSEFSNGVCLTEQVTRYEDKAGKDFGRIITLQDTVYSPEGETYTSWQEFTTSVNDGLMTQTYTFTGHDGLSASSTRTQSAFSGQLHSETDAQNVTTRYQYDPLGRLICRIDAAGSIYESTATWAYALGSDELSTTLTDAAGNSVRTVYDGAGRELKQNQLDIDGRGTWREISARTYDTRGQLSGSTANDWLSDNASRAESAPLATITSAATYDGWGSVTQVNNTDGTVQTTLNDPAGLTHTSKLKGTNSEETLASGSLFTRYDVAGRPISETMLDTENQDQGTKRYIYDGLGRVREEHDELGQVVQYTYDNFGRVLTQTLPDGSVVSKSYAPGQTGDLVASISMTASDADGAKVTRNFGTQDFDSFGRLTRSISGGRTTLYSYTGVSTSPTQITTPAGEAIFYTYIPELGDALSSVTADGITQYFSYDSLTGLMKSADGNVATAMTFDHYPSGSLKSETFTDQNVAQLSVK